MAISKADHGRIIALVQMADDALRRAHDALDDQDEPPIVDFYYVQRQLQFAKDKISEAQRITPPA